MNKVNTMAELVQHVKEISTSLSFKLERRKLQQSLGKFMKLDYVQRNLFCPGTERLKSYAKRKAYFTMLEAHQCPCIESRLTLNHFLSRCLISFLSFLCPFTTGSNKT